MKNSNILVTDSSKDYELIDSGQGEKLERFGQVTLSRPDPQALWSKKLDLSEWKKSQGSFTRDEAKGDWSLKKGIPDRWEIGLSGLKFIIKPTAFKHVGLFPEQSPNWSWIQSQIQGIKSGATAETNSVSTFSQKNEDTLRVSRGGGEIEVLNLFGYTGAATLACAQAGAKVVHVDGSKAAISWGRENAEISGLKDKPIRWILDDARAFVRREIKRERKYDGIIMDPPAFGHGPENELWKIEEHLMPLLQDCFAILKPQPLFFLINGYSAGYSAVAYENILQPLITKYGGSIEIGELTIRESGVDGRLLPAGIFARWCR